MKLSPPPHPRLSLSSLPRKVFDDSLWGLPTRFALISDVLRERGGYRTHAVGKWDVGSYARALWPTRRGFDSFFGLLGDAIVRARLLFTTRLLLTTRVYYSLLLRMLLLLLLPILTML